MTNASRNLTASGTQALSNKTSIPNDAIARKRHTDSLAHECCVVNACAGLNPAAYRECVNSLQSMVDWLCHFRLDMTPEMVQKADQCISALKQVLAHAQEQP